MWTVFTDGSKGADLVAECQRGDVSPTWVTTLVGTSIPTYACSVTSHEMAAS